MTYDYAIVRINDIVKIIKTYTFFCKNCCKYNVKKVFIR